MNVLYGINTVAEALKARGRAFEWVGVATERKDIPAIVTPAAPIVLEHQHLGRAAWPRRWCAAESRACVGEQQRQGPQRD